MEAVAVDWEQVPMTQAAQNTKTPALRMRVVVVPRAVYDKYWPMSWSEVEQAGARGDDGLALLVVMAIDSTSQHAYFREGLKKERLVAGKPCLFRQGW